MDEKTTAKRKRAVMEGPLDVTNFFFQSHPKKILTEVARSIKKDSSPVKASSSFILNDIISDDDQDVMDLTKDKSPEVISLEDDCNHKTVVKENHKVSLAPLHSSMEMDELAEAAASSQSNRQSSTNYPSTIRVCIRTYLQLTDLDISDEALHGRTHQQMINLQVDPQITVNELMRQVAAQRKLHISPSAGSHLLVFRRTIPLYGTSRIGQIAEMATNNHHSHHYQLGMEGTLRVDLYARSVYEAMRTRTAQQVQECLLEAEEEEEVLDNEKVEYESEISPLGISIIVRTKERSQTLAIDDPDTCTFSHLLRQYMQDAAYDERAFKFVFDGAVLPFASTVAAAGIEDGDMVELVKHQL